MYTISLKDGDWDFSNRHGVVATGKKKLVQQLGLWIKEELHVDRFHYDYGSRLPLMIGANQSRAVQDAVEKEIRRIVQNYIRMQANDFDTHPQDYAKDEVIVQLLLVTSEWFDTKFNAKGLHCKVYVKTMAGNTVTMGYDVT